MPIPLRPFSTSPIRRGPRSALGALIALAVVLSGLAAPVRATADGPFSLAVSAVGSPVPGAFFEDIGAYGFAGEVAESGAGTAVEIYQASANSSTWRKVAAAVTDESGQYAARLPVTAYGRFRFAATLGGTPGSDNVATSTIVPVAVADATVILEPVRSRIDSLKPTPVRGRVSPARAGVAITLQARTTTGSRSPAGTAVTNASGAFAISFTRGTGRLVTYRVRAAYQAANRARTEVSAEQVIKRVAVLDPVVTDTTAEEVASTWRAGCPVDRSKLKTLTMNFYGRDKRMHRGLVIIRHDLTDEVIRGFSSALNHRYPIARMVNPNVYGGNDPLQMAANNTSGFNCRKVVGNPYRLSPHAYGIALDVNPVQNPYRDRNGKWWPTAGKKYIDRTPRRWGMLTSKSALTTSLRRDHFFWGGFWKPGRDYQHFEYRGSSTAAAATLRPAAARAGALDAASIPVPKGWRPVARKGGGEEGFVGNGTWVHARDPRVAAREAIALGCAPAGVGGYAAPVAALEGTLARDALGRPGIGLALQFSSAAEAARYAAAYAAQVSACVGGVGPVRAELLPASGGLIDRRSGPDGEWLEVVGRRGAVLVLLALSDSGGRTSDAAAYAILDQIR